MLQCLEHGFRWFSEIPQHLWHHPRNDGDRMSLHAWALLHAVGEGNTAIPIPTHTPQTTYVHTILTTCTYIHTTQGLHVHTILTTCTYIHTTQGLHVHTILTTCTYIHNTRTTCTHNTHYMYVYTQHKDYMYTQYSLHVRIYT